MIRLVLAIGIAAALWPVNDDNQPLGVGNADIVLSDMVSAGYSFVQDAAGFCGRNTETCQTISTIVSETASSIQARIIESNSLSKTSEETVGSIRQSDS